MKHLLAAAAVLALFAPSPSVAHEVAPSPETAWIGGMATAAKDWLGSLATPRGAQLPFADDARRDWHYVPRSRPGVALRDMTAPQRAAATALLRASLSAKGLERAEAIMALEAVLAEQEGSSRRFRDPLNYAVAVFGTPGAAPWGWRVEGHHLSLNVTAAAPGHVSVTPLFTGTNPARIRSGPRQGERVQRLEVELGLELAQSLDARQLAGALLQERSLGNIVAGPGRAEALASPQGLAVQELTAPQQETLLQLVETYTGLARDELGRSYMDLVRAGLAKTRFAWAGAGPPRGQRLLLPHPRSARADRARQHARRRQPRPQPLARSAQRLRPRRPARALRGRHASPRRGPLIDGFGLPSRLPEGATREGA